MTKLTGQKQSNRRSDELIRWAEKSAHPRRHSRCTAAIFQSFVLLLTIAQLSCHRPFASAAQENEPLLLNNNATVRKTLAQGELHPYQIQLSANQYFRILLKHAGLNLQVSLYDSTGRLLKSFNSRQSGQIPLSAIAAGVGGYRLEVQSKETSPYLGDYLIQLVESRATAPFDEDRVAADTAFATGQSTSADLTLPALRQALALYQQAQKLWQKLAENQEEALTLNSIGEIQQRIGETKEAITSFQRALSLCGDHQELAIDIQNNLFSLRKDDPVHCSQLEELSRKIEYKRGAALALDNLAEWTRDTGDRQLTRTYYLRALAHWRALQDRQKQAQALNNLGCVSVELAETAQADDYFTQSLALWRTIDDKRGLAATLTARGNQQSLLGKKQEARGFYEEALQTAEASGEKAQLISISNGVGFFYESYSEYTKALTSYEKALRIAQEVQNEKHQAGAFINIGETYRHLEQPQKALANFREALSLIQKNNYGSYRPYVLLDMGLTYGALGQQKAAIAHLRQAAQLSLTNEDLRGVTTAYNGMGEIYRQSKQLALARQYHLQALQLCQTVHNPFGESQTRHYLAKAEAAAGNIAEALSQIQIAIREIEKSRVNVLAPSLRVSYLAEAHQSYELAINLLMRQARQFPHGTFTAEALTISEQSRARSLLDSINESSHDIKQGVASDLLAQERALQQIRNGKADRKMQLAGNKSKAAELAVITKEVDDLSSQLDDIRSKIRATSPRYAALTQPQPLKAPEIQQLLEDDTMLLEYALGDEQSYLWAVTRDAIGAYTLPNRATIEALVREVYQRLTAPPQREGETAAQWHSRVALANQQYWPLAAQLSQMILGPVAAKLGNKRLVIVGAGALQLLPFAALPAPSSVEELRVASSMWRGQNPQPATQNPQPLILNHEITNLPSASSLKLLREDRSKPAPPTGLLARWAHSLRSWWRTDDEPAFRYAVAVMADPVFSKEDKRVGQEHSTAQPHQSQMRDVDLSDENLILPRLIATREEAQEIQKAAGANAFLLKQGFEVNRSLLESDALDRYGIVHFATHGFWDSVNPELSGIFLSRVDRQGKPLDGTLRLSDIYNLKLPKELVVLSACETAVGKDIRGEGLIALTRGFMYAGATRVMASLWKVEDTATAEMMKIFYQHLLQEKISPAAALRQAQLAMWRKEPSRTPYNWGAFVLQGEYR